MANLTGSPIDNYVQEQINIRQQILGNNPNIQSLDVRVLNNNNKNAWVRLVSSVNVAGDDTLSELGVINTGINFAQNFVLVGGVLNAAGSIDIPKGGVITNSNEQLTPDLAVQYSYGLGGLEYGFSPIPGLTSVNIQHLNRGAIRKFQIKLQAQNKGQLAILEALYLRLGYYMLLEWGHTNYINREKQFVTQPDFNTPAYTSFFNQGSVSSDIEIAISNHRKSEGGNYDGALFKVDNYSWSVNNDGSYDITISGVSKGGLIDSLTIGSPGIFGNQATPIEDYTVINPSVEEKTDILNKLGVNVKESEVVKTYKQTIGEKLAEGLYDELKSAGAIKINAPGSISTPDTLNVIDAFDTSDDDSLITILDQNKSILNQVLFKLTRELKKQSWTKINKKERYKSYQVRPGLLESLGITELNELVSIKFDNVNKESNPYEFNYITLGSLLSIIKEQVIPKTENNIPTIKISDGYEDNLMFTHWFQHSTNPNICLIPYSAAGNDEDNLNKVLSKAFRVGTEGNEVFQGRLMAIHVNIEYISKTLKDTAEENGEINLYNFLDKLMYGIQDALGGINRFTITYDDVNGLNIKDDTIIPGVNEDLDNNSQPTKLRLYGTLPQNEGSFVRNVSAQSKITGKMATQIAIGSTASGGSINESTSLLARWNEGLIDRVQNAEEAKRLFERLKIELQQGEIQSSPTTSTDQIKEELDKKYQEQVKFLKSQYGEFKNQGNPTYTQAQSNLKSLLEYDLAIKTLNGNIAGKGFIPIDLTVELEGISGILLYNKLLTTNEILPASYDNKIDFVVMAMDHTISNNEWVTTLSTLSVPKKSDISKNASTKDNSEFSIPKTSSSSPSSSTPTSPSQASNSGKPEWMSDEAWIALQETENS